ncbi:MAG: hypothetical protein AAF125_22895 [Chloroflexota bacterium]
MNWNAVRNLYTEHYRRAGDLPGYRREYVLPVVRYISTTAPHSHIAYTDALPGSIEDTVERETIYFGLMAHTLTWQVYDYDGATDVQRTLLAHGFEEAGRHVFMVRAREGADEEGGTAIEVARLMATVLQAEGGETFGNTIFPLRYSEHFTCVYADALQRHAFEGHGFEHVATLWEARYLPQLKADLA